MLVHLPTACADLLAVLAAIRWDADPVLVHLGPVTIRWYGLLFAGGFFLGFFRMRQIYLREGRSERDLDQLLIFMIVGTLVGARLGHCLIYEPHRYLSHPLEIVQFWKGGLASHGGVAGILIALAIYARKRPDQSFLWLVDRLTIPAALGAAFIRVGNFFNAEILGTPTDVPWAVIFGRGPDREPRHPAMLYESLLYLSVHFLLLLLYRRRTAPPRPGLLIGIFLVLAFGGRFAIEFLKRRQAEWSEGVALSAGQLLSVPLVLAGLALLAYAWHRSRREPTPAGS